MKLLSRLSLFTVKSQFSFVLKMTAFLSNSTSAAPARVRYVLHWAVLLYDINQQTICFIWHMVQLGCKYSDCETKHFSGEGCCAPSTREGEMIPVFYQSFFATDVSLLTLIPCNSIVRLAVLFIFFLIMLIFYF